MSSFGPDVPVLTSARTAYQGKHAWLLWPALQYRVVTPLVYEPEVNTFQRAMLGLARAGQRDLGTMAELLGMDPEFAEVVRDDLRALGYLDEFGVVTQPGLGALDDGFLDPQQVIVTHVYQDAGTGVLWPAEVRAPMLVGARWADQDWAEVDIGTAEDTAHVRALAIPAKGELPDAPSVDDIVEAVSRGSQAASGSGPETQAPKRTAFDVDADTGVGAKADTGWRRRPPERVTARVSLVAAGQPVYLPVAIVRAGGTRDGTTGPHDLPTWLAFSPFGNRASQSLRRLVAIRCVDFLPLRRRVENLTGRPSESLLAEYDRLQAHLREHYRAYLDHRFGQGLWKYHEIVELLTLLEVHLELARNTEDRVSELNTVANIAWRIQEVVLREVLTRRPYTPDPGPEPAWRQLMDACKAIGLRATEYKVISGGAAALTSRFDSSKSHNGPYLLAAAVLSARQGDADHPVRLLASQRDTLLTDLDRARDLRNDSSHAALASPDMGAVEFSRRLARETVAAFVGVPAPDDD